MHPLPEELLMLQQDSIKQECLNLMRCLVGSEVGTETQQDIPSSIPLVSELLIHIGTKHITLPNFDSFNLPRI